MFAELGLGLGLGLGIEEEDEDREDGGREDGGGCCCGGCCGGGVSVDCGAAGCNDDDGGGSIEVTFERGQVLVDGWFTLQSYMAHMYGTLATWS